jgi:hypothetical protein
MNSPTIEMDRTSALAKLEQYERAAQANPRHTTETDRRIAEGYKVLAKGGRLIDVNEAIRAGGLNLAGIPKLAIARAHAEAARWTAQSNFRYTSEYPKGAWYPTGGGTFRWGDGRSRLVDDRVQWTIVPDVFDAGKTQIGNTFTALTPYIPAPHKPKYKLENYFLLWEANWHALPVDPFLLRPITGALMQIVAEWDVTPLELAAVRAAAAR